MEKIVLFLIVICIFVLFLIRVTVDNKRNVEILRKEFYENPLINNYIIVKNELNDTLEQIVNILSE